MKKVLILLLSFGLMTLIGCSNVPEKEKEPAKMIDVTLQLVDIQGKPIQKQLYYSCLQPTGVHPSIATYTSDKGQFTKAVAVGVEYILEVEDDLERKKLVFNEKMDSMVIPVQVNLQNQQE